MERSGDARAGSWLLIALLILAVGAFGLTRVLRSEDDIVNTVVLQSGLYVGDAADVSFNTTIADGSADVLIIDPEEQRVRTLQENEPLEAGAHEFVWDGKTDDGVAAPAGQYGIRIILGDEGRDIVPPGSIILTEPTELKSSYESTIRGKNGG